MFQLLQSHSACKSFRAWAEVTAMMEAAVVDFEILWGVLAKMLLFIKS